MMMRKAGSGRIRVYDEPVALGEAARISMSGQAEASKGERTRGREFCCPGLGVKPSARSLEPKVAPSRRAEGAANQTYLLSSELA